MNTLNKTTTIKTESSISAEDTVVTLPLSKKTIAVRKGYPADKLALLDKYFAKHKNLSTKKTSVSPYIQDCSTYYDYEWDLANQYQSVSGRHLGIWVTPNIISYYAAYNTYGFNEILINWGDTTNVMNIGFKPDSIMIGLSPTEPASDILNSRSYGYYYFDEPYEHGITASNVGYYAEAIYTKNPNSKCMISDYKWTKPATCNGFINYDGSDIQSYLVYPNMGIMSDQYYLDDPCGTMVDYWNEYFNYYNPYSFADMMDNTMNNAGGWGSCFNWASAHINNIWLYASNTGDESVIQNFCQTAWETGWLYRLENQFLIIWKCSSPSPCTNCNYQTGQGNWYVYDSFYTGVSQYAPY